MDVDARVEFASGQSPVDRGLAEAAIGLADAIARGDDEALRGMLDKSNQQMLDQLMASEQWWEETEKIEAVRVVSIDAGSRLTEEPESTRVMLAVQDPDGAYLMGWSGRKVFEDWVFSATPSSGEERARASAWDGNVNFMSTVIEGNVQLQAMMAKAMAAAETMSLEELLKLKATVDAMDPAPLEFLAFLEREIAKRQKRDSEDAGSGGGGGGGGEGSGERRRGPGPGGPG